MSSVQELMTEFARVWTNLAGLRRLRKTLETRRSKAAKALLADVSARLDDLSRGVVADDGPVPGDSHSTSDEGEVSPDSDEDENAGALEDEPEVTEGSSQENAQMWLPSEDSRAVAAAKTLPTYRKLLLESASRGLVNFRHSDRSRTHVRVVGANLDIVFGGLANAGSCQFRSLDEVSDNLADERTPEFGRAFEMACADDAEYLRLVERLNPEDEQDQLTLAKAERRLKDAVRKALGLRPRNKAVTLTAAEIARSQGVNPSFDLDVAGTAEGTRSRLLLQTIQLPEVFAARINAIRIGARRALEETGVNALYAVHGFLEWIPAKSDDHCFSPLYLLPVEFDIEAWTRSRQFVIRGYGDEAILNPALIIRLEQDEGVILPDPEPDELPSSYFSRVSKAIVRRQGWRVRPFLTIGIFESTAMTMWKDLDPDEWPEGTSPSTNSVVANLLGGGAQPQSSGQPDHDVDELSSRGQLLPTVLPADSSQLSALVDVLAGVNMVINGPPGTGKSQTIANIIAAAMETGKSVLFVAEKMAALEVVKKRLDGAGLGDFVLEVHSTHVSKADVYGSFKNRLGPRPTTLDSAAYDQRLQELEVHKKSLNKYVEHMNGPLGVTGVSLHQAIWKHERLSGIQLPEQLSTTALEGAAGIDPLRRSALLIALEEFQSRYGQFTKLHGRPDAYPWRFVDKELTRIQRNRLVDTVSLLGAAVRRAAASLEDLKWAGAAEVEVATFDHLSRVATALDELPGRLPDDVNPILLQAIASGIKPSAFVELASALDRKEKVEKAIASVFEAPARDIQVSELKSLIRQLAAIGISSISELVTRGEAGAEAIAPLTKLRDVVRALTAEMGISIAVSRDNLRLLESTLKLANNASQAALEMRSFSLVSSGAASEIAKWRAITGEARAASTAIRLSRKTVETGNAGQFRSHALELRRGGLFSAFRRGSKQAVAVWRQHAESTGTSGAREMAAWFEDAARVFEARDSIDADQRLRSWAGANFRGLETDFVAMEAAATFMEESERLAGVVPDAARAVRGFLQTAPTNSVRRVTGLAEGVMAIDFNSAGLLQGGEDVTQAIDRTAAESMVVRETVGLVRKLGVRDVASITELAEAVEALEALPGLNDGLLRLRPVLELLTRAGLDPANIEVPVSKAANFVKRLVSSERELWPGLVNSIAAGDPTGKLTALRGQSEKLKIDLDMATQNNRQALEIASDQSHNGTLVLGVTNRLDDAIRVIDAALATKDGLASWVALQEAQTSASSGVTAGVITEYERAGGTFDICQVWERLYWRSAIETVFREDRSVRASTGDSLERHRRRLTKIDDEIQGLSRLRVAAAIAQRQPPWGNGSGPFSEWTGLALIDRLAQQVRPRVQVREMFKRALDAAVALKPCFMMSPASAAQYLPRGKATFDIVIIDEASQVKAEEVISALSRGKQAVIVGDPMQLPPTRFFTKVGLSDDTEDQDDIYSESVMDQALKTFRPLHKLKWHYRSQHHSLIAFSNKNFYNNELIVFPSPASGIAGLGVHYTHLPDARYQGRSDGRTSGINPDEAMFIARAAVQAMEERPDWTLGVASVNKAQAELIDEEVQRLLMTSAAAREYVAKSEDTLEPFFVKNLENVQGDERDHIVISTVYGHPSGGGPVRQAFGPIAGAHGHRRLNVLFTRARKRVDLISSMTSGDITVSPGSSPGVFALKAYLEYAATGILEGGLSAGPRNSPENDFEWSIGDQLARRGFEVHYGVGVAGYRLDIAVRHPEYAHGYLAGIECDGATYHSAKSARDRDLLRTELLEGLGWKLFRVWSTDWFNDSAAEIARLHSALDERLKAVRQFPDSVRG